jgi:4-hydroxybenzoate polyprenyltransferase
MQSPESLLPDNLPGANPRPPASLLERMSRVLTFIRFSHTIFALPFALGSMMVAARGWPSQRIFGLIVLAMVFARTAGMTFNRLADWQIDKRNPRTSGRHKLMSLEGAVALLLGSSIAFVSTCYFINRPCLYLSGIALVVIFLYSLTKRFTSGSHFVLGLALSLSPIGAWLAVRGEFDTPPLALAAAVMLWVAGFDLIYATQDVEFDQAAGLHSLVVRLGVSRTLTLAQALHSAMWILLAAFGWTAHFGIGFAAGLALILPALAYEHVTARKLDIAAINRAFFLSNTFVGLVFVAAVALDEMLGY